MQSRRGTAAYCRKHRSENHGSSYLYAQLAHTGVGSAQHMHRATCHSKYPPPYFLRVVVGWRATEHPHFADAGAARRRRVKVRRAARSDNTALNNRDEQMPLQEEEKPLCFVRCLVRGTDEEVQEFSVADQRQLRAPRCYLLRGSLRAIGHRTTVAV